MVEKQLLQRYFDGLCSPGELEQVIDYLSDGHADLSPLHALLDEAGETLAAASMPAGMEKELTRDLRRYVFLNRTLVRRLWQTAAAAAVLLPLLLMWQLFRGNSTTDSPALSAITNTDSGWKVIANNSRETRSAVLPDGTRIWLTAYSGIQYQPSQYNVQQRRLKLQGEAFFDVAANVNKPFVVYHGTIATEVLGTTFNIEAYDNEAAIRISLVSGSVQVSTTSAVGNRMPLQALKPGQLFSYYKKDGTFKVKQMVVKDARLWKQGMFVMNDVLLKDALQRVERKYGLTIQYAGQVKTDKMRVTAVFKAGGAEEIIQNLLFVHNLHFTIHNNVVTVY